MQENYHIRDFEEGDFENLIELWKATGIYDSIRNDTHQSIVDCRKIGGKMLLMFEKIAGKLIGSAWMTVDGRRIHLHHFCILPEFQNKGLGKLLGRASLHFVKETGLQLKVEVHKNNYKARKLYESFGLFAYTDYIIYMLREPGSIKSSHE
jgi:ribosomal protein S18 acetylase RimI-like enzyme